MAIDYDSHPAELVTGGEVNGAVTVQDLRNAIPAHCWERSYLWSFWYLVRDVVVIFGLMYAAREYIPLLPWSSLRFIAWASYGVVQGLQFTGLWVLGHECGHYSFVPHAAVNDLVGWVLHSVLLTPYFAWRSTHRRHHIYANNLKKDYNYVPPRRSEYAKSMKIDVDRLEELTEDSPIYTLLRIIVQQLLGWPWYLLTNITASKRTLQRPESKAPLANSHFNPSSPLFRAEEAHLIIASDLGIACMVGILWYVSKHILDPTTVALLYLQPYVWLNHWIVAITFLHHTHPDTPKYEDEAWTFLHGALATVDRNLGFAGKHLLHNIADYHVIHHLFSRIPQYRAEEATNAIKPLLGKFYREDKGRNFFYCLWESFTRCQWVEPDFPDKKPEDRAMWYKHGPSPPIQVVMPSKDKEN